MILPHFQYGCLLWGDTPNNLFLLQKRAIRVISKAKDPLFRSIGILKLPDMYRELCLKFMHKHHTSSLPVYFTNWFQTTRRVHTHNTRELSCPRYQMPKHNFLNRCPRYNIPKVIQSLHKNITDKITTHSINGLSKYAKNSFLNNYFLMCPIDQCYICLNR